MKKYILCFFTTILIFSCSKEKLNIDMIKTNGLKGKSEYFHFVSSLEGYSFNTLKVRPEPTKEQLNDVNYLSGSKYKAIIYKTIDGGKNWKQVYEIDNFLFINVAVFVENNDLFISIKDSGLDGHLLQFNLKTLKAHLLDFNFERMGAIWCVDHLVFINSITKGENLIYFSSFDLKKLNSIREYNSFRSKVCLLNNVPYVLTWHNELYNIESKQLFKLQDIEAVTMEKVNDESLIIGGKGLKDNIVKLLRYNVKNGKIEILKEFEDYSIVKGFQSNDKVIYGFVGNIKGLYTEYDLLYSLDKGKTWDIQTLEYPEYTNPCSLIDNILFINGWNHKIQKIVF